MSARDQFAAPVHRATGQAAANAAQTVSTPAGGPRRVLSVTVKYSGNVTANVTCTLNSGAGAAWDTLLKTIVLTAQQAGVWEPDEEIILMGDDVLDVVAPAGGAGITSAVAIYTEAQ